MTHHATALNLASILDHAARMTPERGGRHVRRRTADLRRDRCSRPRAWPRRWRRWASRPGEHVALSCPNVPWFPIAYFGILKAGAVVVPLNVLLKPREIAYHLRDSDAAALIAFEGTAELPLAAMARAACDEARCPHLLRDDDGDPPRRARSRARDAGPGDARRSRAPFETRRAAPRRHRGRSSTRRARPAIPRERS